MHITQVKTDFPDERWAGWIPGRRVSVVAARIARSTSVSETARANVQKSIELLNADSLRKGGIIASNAVWIPDPQRGEVAAVLDVTLIETPQDPSAPERHLARNLRRDFGWTTRIVDYASSISEVPAGRMTIEQVLLRRFGERRVQAYLFLNVFPPGVCEAVSLVFNTVHLDLVTDLARQARVVAESLELTFGEIPGGRRRG